MASQKQFKVDEGHVIYKAFKSGGVQYYYIKDTFNTFAMRAMDALAIYEQWQMRCTSEYLRAYVEASDAALNKGLLTEAASLNQRMKERLDFAIPTEDIIWNFAAVVYFDENESPYKYDHEYGKEKINKWRKDMQVTDFFSRQPIKALIPLPELSDKDLQGYSKMVNQISQVQLKQVLSQLSPEAQSKGFYQALLYQKSLQQTSAV